MIWFLIRFQWVRPRERRKPTKSVNCISYSISVRFHSNRQKKVGPNNFWGSKLEKGTYVNRKKRIKHLNRSVHATTTVTIREKKCTTSWWNRKKRSWKSFLVMRVVGLSKWREFYINQNPWHKHEQTRWNPLCRAMCERIQSDNDVKSSPIWDNLFKTIFLCQNNKA